jgi:hypothetical protein
MQIARSAAAGANREIAGQVRFSAGREGGYLFVHDVGQAVETIADDAEYALHSARHEGIYELIGDGSSHLLLLESVAAIYFAVIECCPLDAP